MEASVKKWRGTKLQKVHNMKQQKKKKDGAIFLGLQWLHEISKLKGNWIGHILSSNCLLQQVTEGKIKGGDRSEGKTRKKT